MTKIRAIDANNDWEFGQGLGSYRADQEGLAQNIKTKLQEWVGDCFFAADAGIDYNTRLNPNQQNLLEQDVKSLILKVEGVVELTTLSVVFANRTLSMSYSIRTIYSPSIQNLIRDQVEVGL